MKSKIMIVSLLLLLTAGMKAGENDRYVGLQTGIAYPRIFNVVLSYEKESGYHNAWEAYIDYATQWDKCPTCGKVCMDSFWKSRYSYAFGLAYKPAIGRGKNSVTRMRIGSDLGACNREFILGVELGLEYVVTTKSNIQLVFQQKNEVTFWGKPRFKNGILAGIRVQL